MPFLTTNRDVGPFLEFQPKNSGKSVITVGTRIRWFKKHSMEIRLKNERHKNFKKVNELENAYRRENFYSVTHERPRRPLVAAMIFRSTGKRIHRSSVYLDRSTQNFILFHIVQVSMKTTANRFLPNCRSIPVLTKPRLYVESTKTIEVLTWRKFGDTAAKLIIVWYNHWLNHSHE